MVPQGAMPMTILQPQQDLKTALVETGANLRLTRAPALGVYAAMEFFAESTITHDSSFDRGRVIRFPIH